MGHGGHVVNKELIIGILFSLVVWLGIYRCTLEILR